MPFYIEKTRIASFFYIKWQPDVYILYGSLFLFHLSSDLKTFLIRYLVIKVIHAAFRKYFSFIYEFK